MSTRGGKRKGAGRKPGTTRPQLRDYYTEEERAEFFDSMKERAKTNDRIAVWVGDQLCGKAAQAIELGGKDGEPIKITSVNYGGATTS